ncbi:UNVERIFIED_ORG: glycine betaine/proline transport system ATP-binding protein [Pseudomonas lini]
MADSSFSGIQVRNLYKVFGPKASQYVDLVKKGMSKEQLLTQHAHVLGLRDINLDIPAGCIQVVMGLSGSGKSTLIRHLNRLIDPTAGEIIVDGCDITKIGAKELLEFRRQKTAMVFQKFALLPHRTVIENTIYGLEIQGMNKKQRTDIGMRWLERVGLKGLEDQYPFQLSGGMQQRVGLARALSNDAPVLLMDEAYSALDPLIRTDMQSVLLDIQKEIKKTIIFITHDLDEALRLGDQIAILRNGELIQQGNRQDIVLRPADDYVENFVKEVNRGKVVHVDSVMSAHLDRGPGVSTIASGSTLEDAVRLLSRGVESALTVIDASGKKIGTVDYRDLVKGMVSPIH